MSDDGCGVILRMVNGMSSVEAVTVTLPAGISIICPYFLCALPRVMFVMKPVSASMVPEALVETAK